MFVLKYNYELELEDDGCFFYCKMLQEVSTFFIPSKLIILAQGPSGPVLGAFSVGPSGPRLRRACGAGPSGQHRRQAFEPVRLSK